jgi:hypothetical protein
MGETSALGHCYYFMLGFINPTNNHNESYIPVSAVCFHKEDEYDHIVYNIA